MAPSDRVFPYGGSDKPQPLHRGQVLLLLLRLCTETGQESEEGRKMGGGGGDMSVPRPSSW